MTSFVKVPTTIGKLELPHELIGQVLSFLDGRSLASFELTCALTRQYLRDHPGFFKKLLLRELYNFPLMKCLQNKEGKRALISWDGGDFQPVRGERMRLMPRRKIPKISRTITWGGASGTQSWLSSADQERARDTFCELSPTAFYVHKFGYLNEHGSGSGGFAIINVAGCQRWPFAACCLSQFAPLVPAASRASMVSPSPRYLHRVALASDGWYYLFGGHLRLGMSGEVWRFRTEERGHRKSCPKVILKWEQIDGEAVEGVTGSDDGDDDMNDLDSETHHLSEESDLESIAGDGKGAAGADGSRANSDGEDEDDHGHDVIPIGLFATRPLVPNHPAAAWQALAAAAAAAVADAGNIHGNGIHAAQGPGLQAGMWGGQPAAAGGAEGAGEPPNPAGLDADGNPTRPTPRCAASWTCIPGSNMIYLFGGLGSDNNFLGDLWCFHAGSRVQALWELLRAVREPGEENPELGVGEVTVPAGRWGHTMVEHNGVLFMFGGSSPGQAYTGLWRLNASVRPCRWSLLKSDGEAPPPRGGHSATVVRDMLYIFGGNITQSVFNDLWAIDLPAGKAWRQIATNPEFPLPRIGHSAVAMGDRILIFGGRNFNTGKYTAGLSCFDTEKEAFVRFPHAEAFTKRSSLNGGMWFSLRMTGHAAVPCSRGILFIGGLVHNGHSTMDSWVLDTIHGVHRVVQRRRRRRSRALATTGGCSPS